MATELLIAQQTVLRELRGEAADVGLCLLDAARAALTGEREEGRVLRARLLASEKREAAALAEVAQLKAQLVHEREAAAAEVKRVRWELRKRDEAAAATLATAAHAAADSERCLRAELMQTAAQLADRERERDAANAKLNSLRHRRHEQALQKRQDAFHEELQRKAGRCGEDSGSGSAAAAAATAAAAAVAAASAEGSPEAADTATTAAAQIGAMQSSFVARLLRHE
jgi:hypothetical protein